MPEPTIENNIKHWLMELYEIKSFCSCRLEFVEEYRGSNCYNFYIGDDTKYTCNLEVWIPEEVGIRLFGFTHDSYQMTFNNKMYGIALFKPIF
jgi:hypothetical protein